MTPKSAKTRNNPAPPETLISGRIGGLMERSSWIRRMFEEGARLKEKLGEESVFDFTLGNPAGEPPEDVLRELARLASDPEPGLHRYMPNAGYPWVRERVAESLSRRSGLPFGKDNVVMTCGAGGALNVILRALADPGDEVVITAPYFAEYLFYADNHGLNVKIVRTDERFQLDMAELERAMGPKTRIVLLNSPNNPSGAVYPERALKEVGGLLEDLSAKNGRPVYLVMDEPYRKLVYGDVRVPEVFSVYERAIAATSHSKDLNLPGERIGYIAINPRIEGAGRIFDAMTLANRILGFVNAPALFQRLVAGFQDIEPDMGVYERNREILVEGLTSAGYGLVAPDGGFYLFPKSPIEDDVKFVSALKTENILAVPGAGFGAPGHFRLSFCVPTDTCERALPGFERGFKKTAG
ncbi:MAG: pyridoxal phosphate-dependent aminotransferase [Candidatus Nitrospinota bacterium M3_3B_026]